MKFFLGLFESAIEEHKKELHLSESINDIIAVAISHRKIGECLCECKDFKNALLHQQKYLEVCKQLQLQKDYLSENSGTFFGNVFYLSMLFDTSFEKCMYVTSKEK